ncbi:MAG: hypothetical protein ACO24Y_07705, partial [Hylemonella sp.]
GAQPGKAWLASQVNLQSNLIALTLARKVKTTVLPDTQPNKTKPASGTIRSQVGSFEHHR